MVKRKWYVVTVGKNIGVFSTWLEVGPLVKGVSSSVYQSFTTLEEATMVFTREQARGRTRIVEMEREYPILRERSQSNLAYSLPGKFSAVPQTSGGPANSNRPSIIAPVVARTPHSPKNFGGSGSPKPMPISRSASEPPSQMRRFQVIDSFFVGKTGPAVAVNASVSSNPLNTPALTATSRTTSLPRSKYGTQSSSNPRTIVKTPSWVASYPKGQPAEPLSPLNDPGLPLKYFQNAQYEISTPSTNPAQASNIHRLQSSDRAGTSGFLPFERHSATVDNSQKKLLDPRSPSTQRSPHVPDLILSSSLLFSRHSPTTNPRSVMNTM